MLIRLWQIIASFKKKFFFLAPINEKSRYLSFWHSCFQEPRRDVCLILFSLPFLFFTGLCLVPLTDIHIPHGIKIDTDGSRVTTFWKFEIPEGESIFICSGCYNKTPQIGWLINNRNSFPRVLEAGNSKTSRFSVSETCFMVHRWQTSHCVLTWQKGQGRPLGSLLYGH